MYFLTAYIIMFNPTRIYFFILIIAKCIMYYFFPTPCPLKFLSTASWYRYKLSFANFSKQNAAIILLFSFMQNTKLFSIKFFNFSSDGKCDTYRSKTSFNKLLISLTSYIWAGIMLSVCFNFNKLWSLFALQRFILV